MPSGTSSFLGGLAEGIFEAQTERNRRAADEEQRTKLDAVRQLAGMMDDVTPDSRPLLLKQMGDMLSLKGPHRGIWDQLTGQGLELGKQAVGSKLSEIMGGAMGPNAARVAQGKSIHQAIDAGFDRSLPAPMDPLANKIVFRDPQQEALNLARSRAKLSNDITSERLTEREGLLAQNRLTLQNDRQSHELGMLERRKELEAMGKVNQAASALALASGRVQISPVDLEAAAKQIANRDGLNLEKLRKDIGLVEAKTSYFQSQGGVAGEGKPLTEAQRVTNDRALQTSANSIYQQWSKSRSDVTNLDQQQTSLRARLLALANAEGSDYDETRGIFVNRKTGQPLTEFLSSGKTINGLLADMNKISAAKAAAYQEESAHRATLGAQFPDYFTISPSGHVQPKSSFGGVAPTGAARTTSSPATYDATVPQAKQAKVLDVGGIANYKSSNNYKVGDLIEAGQNQYRVVQVLGTSGLDTTYKVKRIR